MILSNENKKGIDFHSIPFKLYMKLIINMLSKTLKITFLFYFDKVRKVYYYMGYKL